VQARKTIYQSRKGGGKEMKKFIALSILGLLILAFSATVYAQPKLEFKASGSINMETYWYQNVPRLNGGAAITGMSANYNTVGANAWNRKNAWLDTRGSIAFDFIMGKELSGRLAFEIDSTHWGDADGSRGALGFWTTDRNAVEVKHLYFDVAIPYFGIPVPIMMRFGAQPLAMRPFVFLSNDGMGITTTIKADPATIMAYWFKAVEGGDWTADDVDVYGLHGNAKIGPVTVGGYGFFYNMNSYPFSVSTPVTITDSGGDTATLPITTAAPGRAYRADMWWLGVYADGKLGPVNLNFDFIYDRGKVEDRVNVGFSDLKYRGWMTKVKIDFPWEMFNFGVQGLYGSGADLNKTAANGLPNATASKVGSFVVPPGSEAGPASSNDSSVMLSVHAGAAGGLGFANNLNGNTLNRGPVGGIWWAKLYGSVKPTPWYKVTLQGLYIGDTTKHGNTLGTARKSDGVTLRDDKGIGWELDLINEFNVYANLKFDVAGGALFRGDALAMWDGVSDNKKFRIPWVFTTRLTYSF
jgi:hypothetical protein